MGRHYSISDIGLRLIKAYEGYRPVDRTLVSGQRVVGYGHRISDNTSIVVSKKEAMALLKDDLAPFEDMVNENVYAPISQSQFDALCSLAFNIGPKAFLSSDLLRALNNGRLLDAANGFDVWRKSEIDGRTYVVDALVRRRTAEKNLFLRPAEKAVVAPRIDLPPVKDTQVEALETADGFPVFSAEDRLGLVQDAPYIRGTAPTRRREDGAHGTLTLSEIDVDSPEHAVLDLTDVDVFTTGYDMASNRIPVADQDTGEPSVAGLSRREETSETISPIAEAAAEVSERLEALIERAHDREVAFDLANILSRDSEDMPSVGRTSGEAKTESGNQGRSENIVAFPGKQVERDATPSALDKVQTDADISSQVASSEISGVDSAEKYIQLPAEPDTISNVKPASKEGPYVVMMVLGLTLMGGLLGLILKGATDALGNNGAFVAFSGFMIGMMVFWGSLFYFLREVFRGRKQKINLKNM